MRLEVEVSHESQTFADFSTELFEVRERREKRKIGGGGDVCEERERERREMRRDSVRSNERCTVCCK